MRLIFLDDSVQSQPAKRRGIGELIALGGVVVPEEQLVGYADDLSAIKARLGMPNDQEIKWKPSKGSFLARVDSGTVADLRQSMIDAAVARDIKSVTVVLDHQLAFNDRSPSDVGRQILDWVYDVVTILLKVKNDRGIVIADKPGGGAAEERRWLADTLKLTNDGTSFSRPERIALPVLTAGSHHVPHLQLADLVVAATTAAVAGRPSGLALTSGLHQLAHKNRHGTAGGAGLKLWPPDLVDLYWWLFGEAEYWRSGKATPLGPVEPPDPFILAGRPYKNNDGLSLPA